MNIRETFYYIYKYSKSTENFNNYDETQTSRNRKEFFKLDK